MCISSYIIGNHVGKQQDVTQRRKTKISQYMYKTPDKLMWKNVVFDSFTLQAPWFCKIFSPNRLLITLCEVVLVHRVQSRTNSASLLSDYLPQSTFYLLGLQPTFADSILPWFIVNALYRFISSNRCPRQSNVPETPLGLFPVNFLGRQTGDRNNNSIQ